MEWQFIVVLSLAVPFILLPAALVWYLDIGGIYDAIKEGRGRKAVREKAIRTVAQD